MRVVSLVKSVILVLSLVFTAFAQEVIEMGKEKVVIIKPNDKKTEPKTENVKTEEPLVTEVKSEKTEVVPANTPEKANINDTKPISDDKAKPAETPKQDDEVESVKPFVDSYLTDYKLGPGDVISIEVFGQCPNYCMMAKKVTPTGTISFPLIAEVFVANKTQEQVRNEITRRLDEYIIDPKVTVSLEQAVSQKFGVFGKVLAPGIRIMDQRYSLYEAIAYSGGFAPNADKKRVTILRRVQGGSYTPTTYDYELIMKNKQPMPFLEPGDQVIIPEKKWSLFKILEYVNQAMAVRQVFSVGRPF